MRKTVHSSFFISILIFSGACASSQTNKSEKFGLDSVIPPDAIIVYDSRTNRPDPRKLFSDGTKTGDVSEWGLLTSADLIRSLSDRNAFSEVYKPSEDREKMIVLNTGVISAFAQHCGMAWDNKNFLPFMQWQRSRPAKEGQADVIATTHGIYQSFVTNWINENPVDCTKIKPVLTGNLFGDKF